MMLRHLPLALGLALLCAQPVDARAQALADQNRSDQTLADEVPTGESLTDPVMRDEQGDGFGHDEIGRDQIGRNDIRLPDIGSSAGQLINPADEQRYGEATLNQIRDLQMLLEDPLLEGYLQALGHHLVANGEDTRQKFTFFFIGSRDINAFATLGGYIGMNAGLFLTARSEDEVAAVVAHEIAHVTQRHIVRAVERQSKETLPIMLGTIAAAIAASQAGGSGDATQAALASGMALLQQRQINHTRSNEHEADRVGIQILARAGYNPLAMADFFARMERALRSTMGEGPPEFLRTHPVNSTRISEAKDRARQLQSRSTSGTVCTRPSDTGVEACTHAEIASSADVATLQPMNPLLPQRLYDGSQVTGLRDKTQFEWAQERMRVLTAPSASQALAEYRARSAGDAAASDAQEYGMALAEIRAGQAGSAMARLGRLADRVGDHLWVELALAEAETRSGHLLAARDRYSRLLALQPDNRAIALASAGALIEQGSETAAREAQGILRPVLLRNPDDASLQRSYARASELAGDLVRAAEAYAEAAYLNGRAEDALNQLQALKLRDDLDYYQRSRIDARIGEMMPLVLELREEGLRADRQGRGGQGLALDREAALPATDWRFSAGASSGGGANRD
jgi:predicted Zn-dependent protease